MKDIKTINGLLIEDDPEQTFILVNLMAMPYGPAFNFAFTCAENLNAGLKALSENDIEVVLLDLTLPDSQGIETVKRVHAWAPDVPIVVLTGMSDETLALEALANGAQDYQVKGNIDGHSLQRNISYAVERHRLQRSLRNLIENAPDGMAVVDSRGLVSYVNSTAEALLSRKSEQILGKPFPYPLSPDRSGELHLPIEGGGMRDMELRVSEIEWKDQPAKLISIRDITDLRRIEKLKATVLEGQKMNKLKDELMSAVSHEMRTPLTVIKAAASNIKEGATGPLSRQQASMIALQYRNIQRLEKIVDNILSLSRLESGKAAIKPRRLNVEKLIGETVLGFRLIAGEQNIMIQQEIPNDLPPIHGDPELFLQVLSNLIDNAMRFTNTRILIRAEAMTLSAEGKMPAPFADNRGAAVLTSRKYVQISVIDDGDGIPENLIGGLFNKFVQINRDKGRDGMEGYKGTGLGLAICKESIELQQGKIWVESVEGRGAKFHFALPQSEPGPIDKQGDPRDSR